MSYLEGNSSLIRFSLTFREVMDKSSAASVSSTSMFPLRSSNLLALLKSVGVSGMGSLGE